MKTKMTLNILSVLLVLSVLLAACQPTEVIKTVEVSTEKEVVKTVEVEKEVITTVEVEKEVVVQVTPTPVPSDRTGGWLDTIIFTESGQEAAVTQLLAGEMDIYAYTISNAAIFEETKASDELVYSNSFGSYNELTFNPAEFASGMLNPFTSPAIREAMNMLVDREYIANEIMAGLAVPKFFPLNSAFPDYAKYVDVARALEAKYAYDPDKANEVITAEMEAMGATMGDVWTFNGEPITIIILIRTEDERRQVGDYVATQLESVGFAVDRQYKTSSEASAIWVRSDPTEGLFHIYTGGWITTAISRDQGGNFDFFYTPRGYGIPLWQTYTPVEEFDTCADKLNNNNFTNLDERRDLFATCMELGLQDSVRVWLVDRLSFTPRRSNTVVAYDLAGAVAGSSLLPYTVRFAGQEGGAMKINFPSILTEPWNPWGGSNWIYDTTVRRTTQDVAVLSDPYTGLAWPQRLEKAEVVVEEGLPVGKTLDWVSLEFASSIEVPGDAWADWDAVNQKFITADERFGEPTTAKRKSVVYYNAGLDGLTWHDGSPMTVADFVMFIIFNFDSAKEDSPIFDEVNVPAFESFMSQFKGVKIVSTEPLVIETYSDAYGLDAELSITTWWPEYGQGQAGWHNLAVGWKAEAEQSLAFTADKADALEVEWMSYIGGPSLEILKAKLDEAAAENFIPYAPTMSEYVTADEATARWANLATWYEEYGHFWIGVGPYYLYKVFPVEGTAMVQHNGAFPDPANKWDRFGEPAIAEVEVDGPGQVTIGQEATFDVFVTFKGEPYAQSDIATVAYLVFDATGALVATGEATATADGQYQVVLSAELTGALEAGAVKLEIAVSPVIVSIPSFAAFEFVAVP